MRDLATTFVLGCRLLTWSCAFLVSPASASVIAPHWVEGVVLAKPKVNVDSSELNAFILRNNLRIISVYDQLGWIKLECPVHKTPTEFSHYLRQEGEAFFDKAEPVFRLTFHDSQTEPPNDPRWPSQWALRSIHAETAWYISTASTNTVVALVDTGMRLTHVDLFDNIWKNPGESGIDGSGNEKATNGIDDDLNGYIDDVHGIDPVEDDSDPTDSVGHGTRVGGVIAATGNNGAGVTGVNWSAQIMPLKIGFPAGSTTETQIDWILECFDYMIEMKKRGVNIRVANNSYGASWFTSLALEDAFRTAGESGILTVCSVGNSNSDLDANPVYPASYDLPTNIAVGSNSSQFEPFPGTSFGQETVHLMAPGSAESTDNVSDTAYANRNGTSYAAAFVTGSIALLADLNPSASAFELKQSLLTNVTQSASLSSYCQTGGSLNLGRAVLKALNWNDALSIRSSGTTGILIEWNECPPGVGLYSASEIDGTLERLEATESETNLYIPNPIEFQRYFMLLGP